MSESYTARFRDALMFAAQLHADQVRKGSGTPYIGHLLGVASIVVEYGGNEDEAIAALLHDAIEDQGGSSIRDRIRSLFGDNVVRIVDGCTDSDSPDPTKKKPWKDRKEVYLKHLRNETDPSILLISAADKLHNARAILRDLLNDSIGDSVWTRFKGGKDGSLWYYNELVSVFREKADHSGLVNELRSVVKEINAMK